jgi:hypothetical protein
MNRATFFIAALVAASALAANGPPLASAWNIATTGNATSSGDLDFRITPNDGSNPVDITVPVISGASQESVARSIGRALSSQLRRDRYDVQLGENGNVLVSDPRGQPNFSLKLVDATIENVRVAVQSVTPSAPPTVPPQAAPAEPPPANSATPPRETPPVTAPSGTTPAPANTPPASPPPANSPPLPNPSPPPSNGDSAGAPASTPPPR